MVWSSSICAVWVGDGVASVVRRMPADECLGEACRELYKRTFAVLCHLHVLALGLGMSDVFSHTGIPAHEIKLQETHAIFVRKIAFVTHPDDEILELGVLIVIKPSIELHNLGSILIRLERLAQSVALSG